MAVNKPIQFKRSDVAKKIPMAEQLEVGELAINFADQKLYTKNKAGTVIPLGSVAVPLELASKVNNTLNVSGTSFFGSAADQITNSTAVTTVSLIKGATVGTNYTTPGLRVVQDILKLRGDDTSTFEGSDSTRAVSIYGTGKSGSYSNNAYITSAGSLFASRGATLGENSSKQHLNDYVLSVNMSTKSGQLGGIKLDSNSESTTTAMTITEGTVTTPTSVLTWSALYAGIDPKLPNPPAQAKVSVYDNPYGFVKMWAPNEYNTLFAINAKGDLYFGGSMQEGNGGIGKHDAGFSVWTKTNLTGVVHVGNGYELTYAVTSDGKLYLAGKTRDNNTGGLTPKTPYYSFTLVPNAPANLMIVEGGVNHIMALTKTGDLYTYGYNEHGQFVLPAGTAAAMNTWTKHPWTGVKSIQCDNHATYLIDKDDVLWVGGYNGTSSLNPKGASASVTPATKAQIPVKVKKVLHGNGVGKALGVDGNLYAIGGGLYGFTGFGTTVLTAWTVTLSDVADFFGIQPMLAVKNDGTIWYTGGIEAMLGTTMNTTVIKTWQQQTTLPYSSDYIVGANNVIYAMGESGKRISHGNTTLAGTSTFKVVLPSATAIVGGPSKWNTIMVHQAENNSPVFRVDGSGNIEISGSMFIKGKEVYHPGNPPSSNSRELTNNAFYTYDGESQFFVASEPSTKDTDKLSLAIGTSVSRIIHNTSGSNSSMMFVLNNTDTKNGAKATNKHELVFSGGTTTSSLTLNGKKILVEGSLPSAAEFGAEPAGAAAGAVATHTGVLNAHPITGIAGLQEALAAKVPNTLKINGKTLSGDITLTTADLGISGSINPADYYTKDMTYSKGEVTTEIKKAIAKIDTDDDGIVNKALVANTADTITGMSAAAFPTYYGKDVNGVAGFHAFAPQATSARLNQQLTIPSAKANVPVRVQLNVSAPMMNLVVQCYKQFPGVANITETLNTYNSANAVDYYYEDDNVVFNVADATIKTSHMLTSTEVRAGSRVFLTPAIVPADYSNIKSFG